MKSVHLKLPATSGNLGPGFDTLALALEMFLEVDAHHAEDFSLRASGRNADVCGRLEENLLIGTYRAVLEREHRPLAPLALHIRNGIPLGMGCGSSAAARLAGIALACQFGNLPWESEQIVAAAAKQEGHPDNVAACWYGGLTIAAAAPEPSNAPIIASIAPPAAWRAILAIPEKPVPTEKSRSVLPASYPARDAIANVQHSALMIAAFALHRAELVTPASDDRLHQPYREKLCPLFPALLPLAGRHGVLSVTLSGAGPSVLLLVGEQAEPEQIREEIIESAGALGPVEIVEAELCREGATVSVAP